MIIVQKRKNRETGYLIPENGLILWFGGSGAIPANFEIDTAAGDAFIRGADEGQASDVKVGTTNDHVHAYSQNTGARADHTHVTSGSGTSGTPTATQGHFGTANEWAAAEGHTHGMNPTSPSLAGGGHSHSLQNTESESFLPPYRRIYWIRATADTVLPIGGILLWDGQIANRPVGTSLCNGNGGTPDLRAHFIYTASADGQVGAAGGNISHQHGNSNVDAAGAHTHNLRANLYGGSGVKNASGYGGITISAQGHAHSVSVISDSDVDHAHSLADTNSANNMPGYMRLYYVMRTV
jgi:hypothetical protein